MLRRHVWRATSSLARRSSSKQQDRGRLWLTHQHQRVLVRRRLVPPRRQQVGAAPCHCCCWVQRGAHKFAFDAGALGHSACSPASWQQDVSPAVHALVGANSSHTEAREGGAARAHCCRSPRCSCSPRPAPGPAAGPTAPARGGPCHQRACRDQRGGHRHRGRPTTTAPRIAAAGC